MKPTVRVDTLESNAAVSVGMLDSDKTAGDTMQPPWDPLRGMEKDHWVIPGMLAAAASAHQSFTTTDDSTGMHGSVTAILHCFYLVHVAFFDLFIAVVRSLLATCPAVFEHAELPKVHGVIDRIKSKLWNLEAAVYNMLEACDDFKRKRSKAKAKKSARDVSRRQCDFRKGPEFQAFFQHLVDFMLMLSDKLDMTIVRRTLFARRKRDLTCDAGCHEQHGRGGKGTNPFFDWIRAHDKLLVIVEQGGINRSELMGSSSKTGKRKNQNQPVEQPTKRRVGTTTRKTGAPSK